jgi:RimJ/RimL family protein N-acetyltransferase
VVKDVGLKDGRTVTVRPLEMADKDALVAFYSSLSPVVLRWSLPPYDKARVERFFGSPEQLIGVVALADGRIVGHLHIFRFVSRMSHVGELIIYLHQDYLNVGLGFAMILDALELAKARGLRRVQLSVIAGNANAIHLYEKLGFKKEGERPGSYLGEDGSYYDSVDMGLILGRGHLDC